MSGSCRIAQPFGCQKYTGRENLVDTIFEGLEEQSRLNITNEPGRFFEVDNREAVKIGHLERHKEVLKVVRPSFNTAMFPNGHVRETVDGLPLRTSPCWHRHRVETPSLWTNQSLHSFPD